MEGSIRKRERVLLAGISAGLVAWSAFFIHHSAIAAIDGKLYFCLFDDAMISMRYAWNLSHGAGLVWNAGERVEGYTNLLMTLLMSLSTLIFDKSAAVLFIQVMGIGFVLGVACVSLKISDIVIQGGTDRRQAVVRVLSFFCALSYYPLLYWSLMGMETGLLTLLLLLSVLFALRYVSSGNRASLFLTAGFLGLSYLTRNDALIFAFPIWLYVIWESSRQTGGERVRGLLPAAGLYLLFIAGQSIFRHQYYGEWLPNTYTLKLAGMPLTTRVGNGIGFVTPFLIEAAPVLALSCLELLFAFRAQQALLLSIVLSAILYQIYVGGDPWPYWRIMSPSMPLLAILFIDAVRAIVAAMSNTRGFDGYFLRNPVIPRKYVTEALLVSVTLLGLLSTNWRFFPEISFRERPYTVLNNWYNVNVAIALDQLTARDASVGVYWAGSIPYFSGRRAVDFLGRSDKYIARLPPDLSGKAGWNGLNSMPGHNKYDLNYSIATLRPTYVQGFNWCAQDLSEWSRANYVPVYYRGVSLSLLKDSPAVLWNKVNAP